MFWFVRAAIGALPSDAKNWLSTLTLWPSLLVQVLIEALGGSPRWSVVDALVVGGAPWSARDVGRLAADFRVCAVINCARELQPATWLVSTWTAAAIPVLALPCTDYEVPPLDALRAAAAFARTHARAGQRVLVHCKAGKGRSAAIAAALLMDVDTPVEADAPVATEPRPALTAVDAYARLSAARPVVHARPGAAVFEVWAREVTERRAARAARAGPGDSAMGGAGAGSGARRRRLSSSGAVEDAAGPGRVAGAPPRGREREGVR
jgi:atypical dual specificity phosphatase